jgi:general secretion pathway protein B
MSFILDALKKSEVERQRQTTPGLIETAVAPRRSRVALWLIVLGGLLAINFAVLLFVLLRGSATPAAAPIAAARPAVKEAPAATAAPEHFSPMDAPVYAPEIPVAPNAPPAAKPIVAPRAAPEVAPDAKPEDTELLPLISEVDLGSLALPELHLDVHVYATKPAERFVYINMRKYHEGATLEEGPVIERIRRDGVVLNFHGVRFILPRAVGQ